MSRSLAAMRKSYLFLCMVLLAAEYVQGQTASGSGAQAAGTTPDLGYVPAVEPANAAPNAVSSDSLTPWLPVSINGESPAAALTGELQRGNALGGGITVTSAYDDNALTQNGGPVGNASFSVLPTFTLQTSQARSLVDLAYSPGITVNQELSQLNTETQAANLSYQYRFTQFLTLRVHDAFSYTNNPYSDVNAGNETIPGSILHQSSIAVITPFADRLSNLGGADLIYQVGDAALLGGSGSSNVLNYSNLAGGPGVQLIDSQSEGGDLFYKHRMWSRQWIGVTYSFQRFNFDGGREQTDSNSVLLFDTIQIRPRSTLSLFGGASYSNINGQTTLVPGTNVTTSTRQWLPSGGITLGWQGEHTGLSSTFSRQVASGGGLLGTVDRYNGTLDLRRQFRRYWTGNANFLYDNNRAIDLITSNEYRTLSATVGLQRQVGEHVLFGASYSRAHQIYSGLTLPELFPDHNRAFMSISYVFSRPLGR